MTRADETPRGFVTLTSVNTGTVFLLRASTVKKITRDERPARKVWGRYPHGGEIVTGVPEHLRAGALVWTKLSGTEQSPGYIPVEEDVAEVVRRLDAAS